MKTIKEALIEGFQYFLQKFQHTTKVSDSEMNHISSSV